MIPQLRVRVAQACSKGQDVSKQCDGGKDTSWSWLSQRLKQDGSKCSLTHNRSERSFTDSLDSSTEEEVCLSPLSQYFCNVEQPPDIYAIMTLDGYCTLEELVKPMQQMADLHDRFRRRLVYRFGAWKAECLENFDVRMLMREVTLDGPDAQLAFDKHMGKLMTSEPLGADGLPPWDVICVHFSSNPVRTDVLMRASHIIGDGQLFMKLIKQIMRPEDATAEADFAATVLGCSSSTSSIRATEAAAAAGAAVGVGSSGGAPAERDMDSDSESLLSEQCSACSSISSSRSETLQDPHQQQQHLHACKTAAAAAGNKEPAMCQRSRPRRERRSAWQAVVALVITLWRLLCMCWHAYTALVFTAWQPFLLADPVTSVKASPQQCKGPRKWSSTTLRLSDFYRTAKALDASINTLAVSCLSGGIRRYLIRQGEKPANRVRLCSMVDTRSMPGLLTGTSGNSNNFSFIGVPLYAGSCSAVERVGRVGWSLSWIRHSLAVPLAIRMPGVINFLFRDPKWSSWAILRCLPSKATIGFSNMRGPAGHWSLSGHPVVRIHNGVQPNAFGCFISLFSYGDTLTFTHTCYTSKTEHPEVLLECVVEEYEAVRKAAAADRLVQCSDSEPSSPSSVKIKAG